MRLGSELFINRSDTPEQVAAHVAGMAAHGLTVARLFLFWDLVNPGPGRWDFSQFDAAFDAGRQHGVSMVPTLWAQTPPGWMHACGNCQDVAAQDDGPLWQAGLDYVAKVVERYHTHPAMEVWIPWNEPGQPTPADSPALRQRYAAFLGRRYGSLAALNASHYRQYRDFSVVGRDGSLPEQTDWLAFLADELSNRLREIIAVIRTRDPVHPVHINPHDVAGSQVPTGQDVFAQARLVDFAGCSAHPAHHAADFPRHRVPQAVGLFAAIARGATTAADQRFWVSELAAGPSNHSASRPTHSPNAADMRRWLWECVGAGAEAAVFWTWNDRDDGGEAGEWALLGRDGTPTRRLAAVADVGRRLHALGPLLAGARPGPAKAAVLTSSDNARLAHAIGQGDRARERKASGEGMAGAWFLLSDLGIEADVIDEVRVREGVPSAIRLLVAPSLWSLEAGTLDALSAWVAGGGHLLVDSTFGLKTPQGFLARGRQAQLAELFGASVHDVDAARDERLVFADASGTEPLTSLLNVVRLHCADGAEPLAVWRSEDDALADAAADHREAAAVRNVHGAGSATWIGSEVLRNYRHTEDPSIRRIIDTLLPASCREAVRLETPGAVSRQRRLATPAGDVWQMWTTGTAQRVPVLAPGCTLIDAVDGRLLGRDRIDLDLDGLQPRWLRLG